MGPLQDDTVRIASLNINNLGVRAFSNPKQDSLKNWIYDNEIGIIGLQEVGVAFHMQKKYDKLQERMRDARWKKIRISQANNICEKVEVAQYGGTAVMAYDEIAARVTSKAGQDTSGLGRWAWLLFEGKYGHRTRVISAYNPCKSRGPETVYMQQVRYFQKQGINECPRTLFRKQLCSQIVKWQLQGDLIVLLIDCNENLTRWGPLHKSLLHECKLIDPIRLAYQTESCSLPPTSLTGSVPIDSIFVSQQLRHIQQGGWLKQGETVGDHRPLYVDIPIMTILGEPPFKIHRPEARRLTCEQPKVIDRFNILFQRQMEMENTEKNFDILMENIKHNSMSKKDIEIDDKIYRSLISKI